MLVVLTLTATAAVAASQSVDAAIARVGVFVASDFPAGFRPSPPSSITHAAQITMAKGVAGCAPYVAIQKRLMSTTDALSSQFSDGARTLGNEVGVFPSDRGATSMLGLFEKPSMVGCLEKYLEKQLRQNARGQVDQVTVTLDRQDIAGLGDDSVVYEGTADLVQTDGTTSKLGLGNATVRVGRALDTIIYLTSGPSLTEVLTPAIDASVGRLRAALGRST